ncbi:MAG: hypothetical protein ACLFUR_06435, partial [Candidatus Hadarchaeia archaeon]
RTENIENALDQSLAEKIEGANENLEVFKGDIENDVYSLENSLGEEVSMIGGLARQNEGDILAEQNKPGWETILIFSVFLSVVLAMAGMFLLYREGKLEKINPLNARKPKQKIKAAKWKVDNILEDDDMPEEEVASAVSRYNKLIDRFPDAANDLDMSKMDYKM